MITTILAAVGLSLAAQQGQYAAVNGIRLYYEVHGTWSRDVAAIKAPTMLVFADGDAMRMAHMVEFYGLLGGDKRDGGLDGSGHAVARLAIVPGTTHYDILSSSRVADLVTPFLSAP